MPMYKLLHFPEQDNSTTSGVFMECIRCAEMAETTLQRLLSAVLWTVSACKYFLLCHKYVFQILFLILLFHRFAALLRVDDWLTIMVARFYFSQLRLTCYVIGRSGTGQPSIVIINPPSGHLLWKFCDSNWKCEIPTGKFPTAIPCFCYYGFRAEWAISLNLKWTRETGKMDFYDQSM